VFFVIILTDLWTPRNVALTILMSPSQKIVPVHLQTSKEIKNKSMS